MAKFKLSGVRVAARKSGACPTGSRRMKGRKGCWKVSKKR